MQEQLTCPECGYQTPFYTCIRCGATIREIPPDAELSNEKPPFPIEGTGNRKGVNPACKKVAIVLGVVLMLIQAHLVLMWVGIISPPPLDLESAIYFIPFPNSIELSDKDIKKFDQLIDVYKPAPERSALTLRSIMEDYLGGNYEAYSFIKWNWYIKWIRGDKRIMEAHYTVGNKKPDSESPETGNSNELTVIWIIDKHGHVRPGNESARLCALGFYKKTFSESEINKLLKNVKEE